MVGEWEATHDEPMGFGVWSGYDIPWMFKHAIEATGITGDPAKVVEERIYIADWLYNRPSSPFLQGDFPISNGLAVQDFHLNQIENNQKVHLASLPQGTEVPPNWDKPALYREYIYDEQGNRVKAR